MKNGGRRVESEKKEGLGLRVKNRVYGIENKECRKQG